MNRTLLCLALTAMQILLFHSNSHAICKEKITTPLTRLSLNLTSESITIKNNVWMDYYVIYKQPDKSSIEGFIFAFTFGLIDNPNLNASGVSTETESTGFIDIILDILEPHYTLDDSLSTGRFDNYYLPLSSIMLIKLEKFTLDPTVISSLPEMKKIKIPNRNEFGWINVAGEVESLINEGQCIGFKNRKDERYEVINAKPDKITIRNILESEDVTHRIQKLSPEQRKQIKFQTLPLKEFYDDNCELLIHICGGGC